MNFAIFTNCDKILFGKQTHSLSIGLLSKCTRIDGLPYQIALFYALTRLDVLPCEGAFTNALNRQLHQEGEDSNEEHIQKAYRHITGDNHGAFNCGFC